MAVLNFILRPFGWRLVRITGAWLRRADGTLAAVVPPQRFAFSRLRKG